MWDHPQQQKKFVLMHDAVRILAVVVVLSTNIRLVEVWKSSYRLHIHNAIAFSLNQFINLRS